jgi:hypothetical protein
VTTLPIRRVVLYKHGVGYFEREAAVEGDQSLALTFKQREVSDVLKSLTVLDLDGGLVSAVSYDSTTPVEKLLAEIALSIPDSGSLTALLPQLKGARVAVSPVASGERTAGVLLGIDTVDTQTPAGATQQVRVSVLTDAGDVRTFDLFDLNLQLLDDGLRKDLDFYLRTQLASKKKDARTFTLFAQGEGKRTVRVSYVLEAPVWKATYRILLEEPSADLPPSPPRGEGRKATAHPGLGGGGQHLRRGLGGCIPDAGGRAAGVVRPRPVHPAVHQAAGGPGAGDDRRAAADGRGGGGEGRDGRIAGIGWRSRFRRNATSEDVCSDCRPGPAPAGCRLLHANPDP